MATKNTKTDADLIFEQYLSEYGRGDFLYEEPLTGTTKAPDYQLPWHPRPLLFEIKGFDVDAPTGSGVFDPYPPLRKKIVRAAEQFKDLEEYSCSLVLHYAGPGLIFLDPPHIYGAMLGSIGFTVPIYRGAGMPEGAETRQVFTTGGRMIHYSRGGEPLEPQNTTINAIVVVEHYSIGEQRFFKYLEAKERDEGRKLEAEEVYREAEASHGTDRDVSLRVVRSVVHENPYARIPLSRDIFVGPYDERYGVDQDLKVTRIFAGSIAAELDKPRM